MILVKNPEVVIFIEVLILAFMSLSLSYTLGSTAGIKAADPSLTYPLVSVEVIHGTMIDQAWLYERTDSDYRLVTQSGANLIIPATNVKEINALPSGA